MSETLRGVVKYRLDEAPSPVRDLDPERDLFDAKSFGEDVPARTEELREAIRQQDWARFGSKGREMRARGERELRRLLRVQEKLNEARARAADENGTLNVQEPSDTDDVTREEILQRVRDHMAGPLGSFADDPEEFSTDLGEGTADVPDWVSDEVPDARVTVFPKIHRELRRAATYSVVVGYESELKADLFSAQESVEPARLSTEALEAIEGWLDEVRDSSHRTLGRIQGSLVGEQWDDLEDHCERGISRPLEDADDLIVACRKLRAARKFFEESSERGSQNDAVEVARVEVALHRTVRTLQTLLGASYQNLFVARQRGTFEEAEEAVERARETHFESLVRDGVNVDLDDLADGPEEYDGRLVETEGFVERLHHETDDGYGTEFELVDRYHDRRVAVFYPYRDLTERFLRDGAYLVLHGEFTANSEYQDGDPSIQLDTVNVGENGEESWLDAVVSDLSSDFRFELYPSHANAMWSLEPPRPDASGGEDE